jgi:hypothetical protein
LPPSSKTVRPEDIIVIDSDDDDDEVLDLQRVAFRIFGPPDIEQEMAAAEARRARLEQADELQQALLDSQHAADERQQQVKELQQKVFTQAQEISAYVLSAIAQEKTVERAETIITEQRDAIAKADRLAVEQKTKADAEVRRRIRFALVCKWKLIDTYFSSRLHCALLSTRRTRPCATCRPRGRS